MNELPVGLQGLAQYPQFILYELVPRPNKPGKTDKFPLDPKTNLRSDAHNPAIWITAQEACTLSSVTGYGVGFVFTHNDPFFFIDIDDAFDGQRWTEESEWLCNELAGAAIEISQSGRGKHIFGTAFTTEERKKKSDFLKFDLYTSARFVALTGNMISGDVNFNAQGKIDFIVNEYLRRDINHVDIKWDDNPCMEWSGHDEDTLLIEAAIKSKSAESVFNNAVSFADLWYANEDKLKEKYPDDQGDDTFDHSRADAALMQHLAFWTGKNASRMDRLFRQSALMRDKYDKRGDNYVVPTISGAVNQCKAVHQGVKKGPVMDYQAPIPAIQHQQAPIPAIQHQQAPIPAILDTSSFAAVQSVGDSTMTIGEQMNAFNGCVYVSESHSVYTPAGELLKPSQFDVIYGGFDFCIDYEGRKTTKSAFEAFTQSKGCRFPKAARTCFRPEFTSGAKIVEGGTIMVNTYVPLNIRKVPGDISLYENFMRLQIPNDEDRLKFISYMAAVVQYPGVKFQWCPVLQGSPGNGKTLHSRVMTYAVGDRYCHSPKASELAKSGSTFNGWMRNKLFVSIEEICMGNKRELVEMLKDSITNDRIEGQSKGVDQNMIDNRANFLLLTNHRDGAIKQRDDRRYMVLFTAQQSREDLIKDGFITASGENTLMMSQLYNWLKNEDGYAKVAHALSTFIIPEQYNPATLCQVAPATTSTDEAIYYSMGGVEHEVIEAIEQERLGFSGGIVSSIALGSLLKELRMEVKIPNNKRRDFMRSLGFDYHPALANGRLHKKSRLDGGKSVLYVKIDHLAASITDPNKVLDHYEKSNQSSGAHDFADRVFK